MRKNPIPKGSNLERRIKAALWKVKESKAAEFGWEWQSREQLLQGLDEALGGQVDRALRLRWYETKGDYIRPGYDDPEPDYYEDLYELIAYTDPTPNGSYAQWIYARIRDDDINDPEDMNAIHENLVLFERLRRERKVSGADINRMSVADLQRLLLDFGVIKIETPFSKGNIGKVVFESDDLLVYETRDASTAKNLSQGTKWCVRGTEYSQLYTRLGNLYFFYRVYSEKDGRKKWVRDKLLNVYTGQFMYVDDEPAVIQKDEVQVLEYAFGESIKDAEQDYLSRSYKVTWPTNMCRFRDGAGILNIFMDSAAEIFRSHGICARNSITRDPFTTVLGYEENAVRTSVMPKVRDHYYFVIKPKKTESGDPVVPQLLEDSYAYKSSIRLRPLNSDEDVTVSLVNAIAPKNGWPTVTPIGNPFILPDWATSWIGQVSSLDSIFGWVMYSENQRVDQQGGNIREVTKIFVDDLVAMGCAGSYRWIQSLAQICGALIDSSGRREQGFNLYGYSISALSSVMEQANDIDSIYNAKVDRRRDPDVPRIAFLRRKGERESFESKVDPDIVKEDRLIFKAITEVTGFTMGLCSGAGVGEFSREMGKLNPEGCPGYWVTLTMYRRGGIRRWVKGLIPFLLTNAEEVHKNRRYLYNQVIPAINSEEFDRYLLGHLYTKELRKFFIKYASANDLRRAVSAYINSVVSKASKMTEFKLRGGLSSITTVPDVSDKSWEIISDCKSQFFNILRRMFGGFGSIAPASARVRDRDQDIRFIANGADDVAMSLNRFKGTQGAEGFLKDMVTEFGLRILGDDVSIDDGYSVLADLPEAPYPILQPFIDDFLVNVSSHEMFLANTSARLEVRDFLVTQGEVSSPYDQTKLMQMVEYVESQIEQTNEYINRTYLRERADGDLRGFDPLRPDKRRTTSPLAEANGPMYLTRVFLYLKIRHAESTPGVDYDGRRVLDSDGAVVLDWTDLFNKVFSVLVLKKLRNEIHRASKWAKSDYQRAIHESSALRKRYRVLLGNRRRR